MDSTPFTRHLHIYIYVGIKNPTMLIYFEYDLK